MSGCKFCEAMKAMILSSTALVFQDGDVLLFIITENTIVFSFSPSEGTTYPL